MKSKITNYTTNTLHFNNYNSFTEKMYEMNEETLKLKKGLQDIFFKCFKFDSQYIAKSIILDNNNTLYFITYTYNKENDNLTITVF